MNSLPTRDQIAQQYKWNLSTIFASTDEWEVTFTETEALAETLRKHDPNEHRGPPQTAF